MFLRSGSFCRYHCQEFPLRSFLNRLTSFISALISSSVNSGVSPLSAADRRLSNAARALAAASSSSFALMGKGMLLLRMTALTKMLMAVFALMPNCSQRRSNCDFCCASMRAVIAVCAIMLSFRCYIGSNMLPV